MCIFYKSVDDFINNVLFLVFPSFFGDVYKYVNEFINIDKKFINMKKFLFEFKSLYMF